MKTTKIEWCDVSANLLKYRDTRTGERVWACQKVSDGCKHCYAEAIAKRFKRGGPFDAAAMKHVEPYFDEGEAMRLLRSKKLAGKRVFVDDMTDLFGDWVPDEIIDRHFAVFALRPDVTWMVLTKRPERMAEYQRPIGQVMRRDFVWAAMRRLTDRASQQGPDQWPLPNVWLGTSVEDQATADARIPHLLRCPAACRMVSYEPALSSVDLSPYIGYNPVDGAIASRSGAVPGSKDGPSGDHAGRHDLESCRDAGKPLERSSIASQGRATASRTQPGDVPSGSTDVEGQEGVLPRTPACVDALQRADSTHDADQPHQREEDGQPARESGVGDALREHSACGTGVTGGTDGESGRAEEPCGKANRLPSRGDTGDLRIRKRDTGDDRQEVRGVAPDHIKGGPRGFSPSAGGANRGLHSAPQQRRRESPIGFVVAGGESGPGARPCDVAWIRSIVEQCRSAGVACFTKQVGSRPMMGDVSDPGGWPTNDGPVDWDTGEITLRDPKGGDPDEWPEDLRVREFPEVTHAQ